jgi:hypothetical protein
MRARAHACLAKTCTVQDALEPKLPGFVQDHDRVLEDQPLHDYGYVQTPDLPLPGPDEAPI